MAITMRVPKQPCLFADGHAFLDGLCYKHFVLKCSDKRAFDAEWEEVVKPLRERKRGENERGELIDF